jgi:hypothetical protein
MKYSANGDENEEDDSYRLDQTITEEFNDEEKI